MLFGILALVLILAVFGMKIKNMVTDTSLDHAPGFQPTSEERGTQTALEVGQKIRGSKMLLAGHGATQPSIVSTAVPATKQMLAGDDVKTQQARQAQQAKQAQQVPTAQQVHIDTLTGDLALSQAQTVEHALADSLTDSSLQSETYQQASIYSGTGNSSASSQAANGTAKAELRNQPSMHYSGMLGVEDNETYMDSGSGSDQLPHIERKKNWASFLDDNTTSTLNSNSYDPSQADLDVSQTGTDVSKSELGEAQAGFSKSLGRTTSLSPLRFESLPQNLPEDWDWESYLRLNPDVATAVGSDAESASLHWQQWGHIEKRPYKASMIGAGFKSGQDETFQQQLALPDEAEGQAAATQQAGSSLSSSQALGSTSDDMPVLSASSSSSQGTSFGNLAAQNLGQSGSASEDSVVRSDSDYSATTNNMQGQDHSIKDSLTQQTDSATELADGSNSGSSLAGGAAESGVLTANEALDLAS